MEKWEYCFADIGLVFIPDKSHVPVAVCTLQGDRDVTITACDGRESLDDARSCVMAWLSLQGWEAVHYAPDRHRMWFKRPAHDTAS
jgi:hypothetical protein